MKVNKSNDKAEQAMDEEEGTIGTHSLGSGGAH